MTTFDKNMSAVAFAEAGEHETARRILEERPAAGHAHHPVKKKSKPYLNTAIFGAISISAYVVLFTNEKLITELFTMGGWRWAYPVGVAFFFSFIHGAFGSNLLSVLGLEAKK